MGVPSMVTTISSPPLTRTRSILPVSGRIIVLELRRLGDNGFAG
jgi:hypothetical protein